MVRHTVAVHELRSRARSIRINGWPRMHRITQRHALAVRPLPQSQI
jgi:hypothetical protein